MSLVPRKTIAAICLIGIAEFNLLPCSAELPPIIPRQVLFGNPVKTTPRLSPDGTMLSYLAPDSNGVLNVWLSSIGKSDDRVVTHDKKRGVRRYNWQPDGKHILYMQDQDGDENWHVFQTEIKTGATRDITPFLNVKAAIEDFDFKFPDEVLVGMNLRDDKTFDVYHVDMKNGAVEMICQNPGDVADWSYDNNMKIRAATATTSDGGHEIRVKEKDDAQWQVLSKFGAQESDPQIFGFDLGNKSLWMSTSLGSNTSHLVQVDLTTRKDQTIFSDKDYDVTRAMIDEVSHELLAVAVERERVEWQAISKDFAEDLAVLKKVNPGDFGFVSESAKGDKLIVGYDGDINAGTLYYLYDRPEKKATYLFCSRPELEKCKLATMEPVTITARDGMKIHCYLTLPPGVEAKNLPLILYVHGGPWGRDSWGFNNDCQWLANRGFAVLQVNFRGSTGYGKEYLHAGDREWAGKMHTDLLDAKQWAIKQGYADAQKTCIYGGSYGGYATLVAATFTPNEFVCGVDLVGPSNLVSLFHTIPPYWELMRKIFATRVGDVDKEKEFLESRSPLFKADKIKMPLLIAQGAHDPRVKQAESDQIVAAIRKNNRPVEYMVFPDEGHGMERPENLLKFYAKAEEFLSKYMGTRFEPASSTERSADLMK